MIRILQAGDESAAEEFLAARADTSMFLRANLRRAGFAPGVEEGQGTWAAEFNGDRIAAIAAHFWNGMLLLQSPRSLEAVAREALRASGRKLRGLSGPWEQVIAARDALVPGRTLSDDRDGLYALSLDALQVPARLASGEVICRQPRASELGICAEWRIDYLVETRLGEPGPALRAAAYEGVDQAHQRGDDYVLEEAGALVAYSTFNARVPGVVQVGGVWTPPAARGRGHGRCVVAGSLLHARDRGEVRALLFTMEANHAAVRAYEALGFRRIGDYGLMLVRGA